MMSSESFKPLVLRLAEHALLSAFEGKSALVPLAVVTDAVNQMASELKLSDKQVRAMLYEISSNPDQNLGHITVSDWVPRAAVALLGGTTGELLRADVRAKKRETQKTIAAVLETVNDGAFLDFDQVPVYVTASQHHLV